MSESIDKVFVKAISTIKTMSSKTSRNSTARPPLQTRVKLYGLYKQATEGDIDGLQISSDISLDNEATNRKLESWKQQSGLSKTEAKKLYIECLIDAMSSYSNDSGESRELLDELEFMWEKVRDVPLSSYESLSGGEPQQLFHGGGSISRSHSPALSLYRMASGSGGSRIPSAYDRRSSMDNLPLTTSKNRSISTNTVVSNNLQQQTKYSQINSNIPNRSVTPSSGSNSNSKDIHFLKWQNDINSTLNKLSYEIANMRSMTTTTTQTPIRMSTPIDSTPSNKSNLLRTIIKVKQLIILLFIKIYKTSKRLLSQAIVDSVIIFILISIAKRLKLFNSTSSYSYNIIKSINTGKPQLVPKLGNQNEITDSTPSDLLSHAKDSVNLFLDAFLRIFSRKHSKNVVVT